MKSSYRTVVATSCFLVACICVGCGYNAGYEVVFSISDELGRPLTGEEIAVYIPNPCHRELPRGEHPFEDYSLIGSVTSTDSHGSIAFDVPGTSTFCLPSMDQLTPSENASVQCWVQFAFAAAPEQHWLVAADPEIEHPRPVVDNIQFVPAGADLGEQTEIAYEVEGDVDFSTDPARLTITVQKRGSA